MNSVLIGYGYWGRILEKYIINSEFFQLCTIIKHRNERELYAQVMSDKSIEVIFVCTPIETHYTICRDAIIAGKHVFCEKPLCKSEKEILYLKEIAESNNLTIYTDYIYRLSPSINFAKSNIEKIGEIVEVNCNITQWGNFYPTDGVYDVIGVHAVSVLLYIFNVDNISLKDKAVVNYDNNNQMAQWIGEIIVDKIHVNMNISLISSIKQRNFTFRGKKGKIVIDLINDTTASLVLPNMEVYKNFDEKNNLALAINDFYKKIEYWQNDCLFSYNVSRLTNIIKNSI